MARGRIYILINSSMPGLVKVGKTKQSPNLRATQLSSATGVPEKFEVYKEYEVADCEESERYVHSILERMFERPNESREFFKGDPLQISLLLDEALSSRLSKPESYTLSTFESALLRLDRKEFTLCCFEFENIFKDLDLNELKIGSSEVLQTAAGAYLASCYGAGRKPLYTEMLGHTVKNIVVEKAIKFAEDFESDPTMSLIQYVRNI